MKSSSDYSKRRAGSWIALLVAMVTSMRPVNWIEHASRQISGSFSEIDSVRSLYITQRLGVLLLERLPTELSHEVMALLPTDYLNGRSTVSNGLRSAADSEANRMIGYPDFVDQVSRSFTEQNPETPYGKIADAFLWAVAQEITPELKAKLSQVLPTELSSRMNLYSGGTEDSKVA